MSGDNHLPPPSRGRAGEGGRADLSDCPETSPFCEFGSSLAPSARPPSLDPSPSRGEGREEAPRPAGGKRPLTHRARLLRDKSTFAERRLWEALRGKKLEGLRFRRQQPIGPYIADFFCPSAKLIVELDGYFHSDPLRIQHDEARTAWLGERGYRVLRFDNDAILEARETVLETILRARRGL